MTDILVPITIFGTIYGIFYLHIRKKERMALLDRGLDPRSFESDKSGFSSLKYGLLFIGVGLGLILANILISLEIMERDAAYFSLVSLFGGIALIVDYFLEISITRKRKQEKSEEDQTFGGNYR